MLLDLGFLLFLVVWSVAVGRRLLALLDPGERSASETVALAIPLGLGLLSLGSLGLGELGRLDRSGLAALLACGLLLGLGRETVVLGFDILVRHRPFLLRRPALPRLRGFRRDGFLVDVLMLVLVAVALLGSLIGALAPVTDGDALCYHLQVPKVFLSHRSVVYDPDLHETVYPLLTELLYAVALGVRGPVACRLVQWLLGLVFAANVMVLARPSLGSRAWWAGTIALLVPAVSSGMGAPLNDVALAAFGTAALVGWSRWHDRPDARTALLTGVLTGLALGVKYPALVLAGLLGAAIAVRPFLIRTPADAVRPSARRRVGTAHRVPCRGGRCPPYDEPTGSAGSWMMRRAGPQGEPIPRAGTGTCAKSLGLFLLAAVACGGWWYWRAWIHTGNPVYPFFRDWFGGAGLDEVLDPARKSMKVGWWNVLTALAPMTLQPQRFDSFSHQFGPLFLLFVPALVLEKAPRRLLGLVALGYLFLMLCVTQRQSTRFVLIAVGPMSVAAAWLASTWTDRRTWPSRLLVAAMLLGLTMEAGMIALRTRPVVKVVLGGETADQFLARREPTYRVGRWVAEKLPPNARIVGQDHRGFYFPCAYTMELAHRRRTGLGRRNEPAEVIVAHLRREGFTHLLLCPPVPETAVEFDPTLGRLLARWLESRRPLYRKTLNDADGVARRYAIYALADERLAHSPGRIGR